MLRRDQSDELPQPMEVLGKAAILTLVIVAGAVAVSALIDYVGSERLRRVSTGLGANSAADTSGWLRKTAERLKQNSHNLLDSVDPAYTVSP